MAMQHSVAVRNGQADAFEVAVGTDARLKLRTGAQPANCAAADTGTEIAVMVLPSDWLAAAASGSKAKSGTWQVNASAAGIIAHYRIYASDGVTCHEQGSVTITGGGGDMTVNNPVIESGQQITVTAYSITVGNA